MNTYTSITNMCVYHGWTSMHWSCWTTVDSWGIMPQFSFCSTFHIAGAHCTTRHCIKDCVFGSLTLGCACIASVYFLELVFSIPRDRPRIILLLRCSVAGSPVRNPGSLSLVGNDPQKKPFICLSPACTSQQSQLSCSTTISALTVLQSQTHLLPYCKKSKKWKKKPLILLFLHFTTVSAGRFFALQVF